MAKYAWQGDVLSITLSDDENAAVDLVFDISNKPAPVRASAEKFGWQTALRNSTAGKMDDLDEARKALLAKAKVFETTWAEERAAKAKLELTEGELTQICTESLVAAKQQGGDKRSAMEIMKAFNKLEKEQQKAVIASIQPLIDKAIKAKLKQKREVAKTAAKVDQNAMKF